jgi:hypothetical protein
MSWRIRLEREREKVGKNGDDKKKLTKKMNTFTSIKILEFGFNRMPIGKLSAPSY